MGGGGGGGPPQAVSSRGALAPCAASSPLYGAWLDTVPGDLAAARAAIAARDLDALGAIAQGSALAMHAAALASRPPVRYWQPTTLALLDAVDALPGAHYTIDAGPHVKVLTSAARAPAVAERLEAIEGVSHVIVCGVGGPATPVGTR